MGSMYDENLLSKLEEEEHELTVATLLILLAYLNATRSDIEYELRKFYQKYGKDGVVTYADARKWLSKKDHQRRLTWLLALTSASFTTLFGKLKPKFNNMIDDVIKKEFDFFGVAIDPPKLNWGVDDLTWIDRLADDVTMWNAYVANDIKRSMLAHKNIEEVSKALDKRFLTMETVIKRLAITETSAVGSIARKAAFKELGITKYKYYAREDERTCEYCGSLHGLIFPISAYEVGSTAPCIHPMCRCFTVPIRE